MDFYKKDFWERHRLSIQLGALIFLGVLLIELFGRTGRLPVEYVEHLGMALAIGGVVGLFIEVTLQQDIVHNVFKAAIGYLLPEELRSELHWIYGQKFLCTNHVQSIQIAEIPGKPALRVKSTVTRQIKNITNQAQTLPISIGVNEWFNEAGQSEIKEVTYTLGGKCSANFGTKCKRDGAYIRLPLDDAPKVSIDPEQTIAVHFVFEEVKHLNDWTFFLSATPTVNMNVNVSAAEGMMFDVQFDSRTKVDVPRIGPNTWQFDGLMLPYQTLRIMWYPKSDYDKFVSSQD